ncbi:MAG: hypothetical protein KUL82_08910 [Bdellovibrio sp.]|nr:hypothetical protein [Bdellovibrio sp.]
MKFTLIILTVLAPFFAHAGGGGGLRPGMQNMMMKNPEYVYNLGELNGVVQFAYGQYQGTKWNVEKLSLPVSDLQLDPSALSALRSSKELKTWIEVK